jgi:hypothetical protein
MAGYAYPPPQPSISGDIETISRFLNSPTQLNRRLRSLAEQRYIADTLLSQRFQVQGGAVVYETGESIFSADNPAAVNPGSEYTLTSLATGNASVANTVKWGQAAIVTDESIARNNFQPVNRALTKLVNSNVKFVDSIALSAISTAVTQSTAAAAAWTTAGTTAQQVLTDVANAKANILALNQGYNPDTVVLDDLHWAAAFAKFTAGGFLPRETDSQNPLITGSFPVIDGMRWLASPNVSSSTTVLVLDSTMLGGMADENLGGPGYMNEGALGVQGKSIREDDKDQYRLQMRRVTVPIIQEAAAAWKITSA